MVKLLRVVSPQPSQGQTLKTSFQSFLNDGFTLSEYSKVAVKSVVLPLTSTLKIDDTNNIFQIKLNGTDPFINIQLTNGIYELNQLFNHINNKICENLLISYTYAIGTQLLFSLDVGNRLLTQINFDRIAETPFDNPIIENITVNDGKYNVTSTAPDPADGSANVVGTYIISGCGYFRTVLNTIGNCYVALTSQYSGGSIPENILDYYINILPSGKYGYFNKDTNNAIESTVSAAQNDTISIEITGRRIKYVVYDNTGNAKLSFVHQTNYFDLLTNYRQCLILLDKTVVLGIPVSTNNPLFTTDIDNNIIIKEQVYEENPINTNPVSVIPVGPKITNNKFTIKFNKPLLSKLLGLIGVEFSAAGLKASFKGIESIDYNNLAKSIILECPSLASLESYDSTKYRRRPILDIVPVKTNYADSMVTYQPSFPVFLEINNQLPILLRNLLINVYIDIDNGEELAECDDQCEITLLFSDKDGK